MASWRTGTCKQYETYLRRWLDYCHNNGVDVCQPELNRAIEFLVSLYHSGLGYSAVSTARSALSSIIILDNGLKFGEQPLVCRCLKGIFELKPALPKYSEIWDVNIVLDYLKNLPIPCLLSMKELTLKLNMLLCLTTGQRGETIHKLDTEHIQEMEDRYRIIVMDKLKQTRPGKHLEPIVLLAFTEDKKLCVVEHLKEYLLRTKPLRNGQTQLMISYVKPSIQPSFKGHHFQVDQESFSISRY